MPPTQHRTFWIDSVKGAVITLVVFGHCWRGLAEAGLFGADPTGLFEAVDSRIYAFHMPLFFLLSGLFIVSTIMKQSSAAFFKSRIRRLLYPLVLWTYIFIGVKLLAGQLANSPLQWSEVSLFPIPGQWQFWFLWALFLQNIFLLLCRPLFADETRRKHAVVALLIAAILCTTLPWPQDILRWCNLAPLYLPYLLIGATFSAYGYVRDVPLFVGVACIGIFSVILAAVPALQDLQVPSIITATILCSTCFVGLAWLLQRPNSVSRGLSHLGAASMIIFLSHTIFSAGTRIALSQFGIDEFSLHLILGTLTGLLLPIGLLSIATRYRFEKLLGA